MSLLSYTELCELVERGVITNVEHDQINATSIDITLGDKIMVEDTLSHQTNDYSERGYPVMGFKGLGPEGHVLVPGEFILAQSQQVFNLPNDISAEYKLKSSMARIGIEHLNAGWCDAGWNGSVLTLELKNMLRTQCIRIRPGDRIGQMVFFKHTPVPADRSYAARGRYNGDKTVSGIKE